MTGGLWSRAQPEGAVTIDAAEAICVRIHELAARDGTHEEALRVLMPYSLHGGERTVEEAHRRCVERAGDDPAWQQAGAMLAISLRTLPFRRGDRG